MVLEQIKFFPIKLFVGILSVFKRIYSTLCCFTLSRRRKTSQSDPEVLHSINVIPHEANNFNAAGARDQRNSTMAERDWNSWDDSPRTISEHIEQYRQRIAKPTTPQTEEPEPDFFSELAPVIQPQPKFFLEENRKDTIDLSRLEAKTDIPISTQADLEDWDDEETGGWDELGSEQTKQLIREKRRELRNQRQKAAKLGETGIVRATNTDASARYPVRHQQVFQNQT